MIVVVGRVQSNAAMREALEQHFATAHIAAFMREIPSAIVAPPDVQFHTIASTENLDDVSGSRR